MNETVYVQLPQNTKAQLQLTLTAIVKNPCPATAAEITELSNNVEQLTGKISAEVFSLISTTGNAGEAVHAHLCGMTILADDMHYGMQQEADCMPAKRKLLDTVCVHLLTNIEEWKRRYHNCNAADLQIPGACIVAEKRQLDLTVVLLEQLLQEKGLPREWVQLVITPFGQLLAAPQPAVTWKQLYYFDNLTNMIRETAAQKELTVDVLLQLLLKYNFNSDCLADLYFQKVDDKLGELYSIQERINFLELAFLQTAPLPYGEHAGLYPGKPCIRQVMQAHVLNQLQIQQQLKKIEQQSTNEPVVNTIAAGSAADDMPTPIVALLCRYLRESYRRKGDLKKFTRQLTNVLRPGSVATDYTYDQGFTIQQPTVDEFINSIRQWYRNSKGKK
jgi:hypothetical protein